jgi:hypothetical protein
MARPFISVTPPSKTAPLPPPGAPSPNVFTMPGEDLKDEAARLGIEIAARQGRLAAVVGELDRRRSFDDDGATSMAAWLSQRNGVSERTGRTFSHIGERLLDLPHLDRAFQAGEVGLDKVMAVITTATPESDAEMTETAKSCSVRELHQLARRGRGRTVQDDDAARDGSYVRFNDANHTVSGKLAPEDYALVKNSIDEVVKATGSDGETPLDQRRADALVRLCGSEGGLGGGVGGGGGGGVGAGRYLVVIHVDFEALRAPDGTGVAELERLGLVSAQTARRIGCGADIAVAFDDEDGHTMFEGRAKRFATETQRREAWRRDRKCRHPGCEHTDFMVVHHIIEWEHGGLTDLSNLIWLCEYHHHQVHRSGRHVAGDANGELTFSGPTGHAITSRPSPLWTKT